MISTSTKKICLLTLGILIWPTFFMCVSLWYVFLKEVSLIWESMRFTVYSSLFVLFSVLMWKKISDKESNLTLVKAIKNQILLPLIRIYESALMTVHDFFIAENRIPVDFWIEKLINYIYYLFDNRAAQKRPLRVETHYFYAYSLINLMPRVIIVFFLIYDVFWLEKFHLTYKVIPVLILPLAFNVTNCIMREFLFREMNTIQLVLDLEIKDEEGYQDIICTPKTEFQEEITQFQLEALTELTHRYQTVYHNFIIPLGFETPVSNLTKYKRLIIVTDLLYIVVWGYLALGMGYVYLLQQINIYTHL